VLPFFCVAILRSPNFAAKHKNNTDAPKHLSAEAVKAVKEACEFTCGRNCKKSLVKEEKVGDKLVQTWEEKCELDSHCVTACETEMYQCVDRVPETNFNHTKGQISPCQEKVLAKYKTYSQTY